MTTKHTVLIVNDFHSETIQKLDELYDTHHLWEFAANEKASLLKELDGKCEAIATASWMLDKAVYQLNSLKMISCFGVGVDAIDFELTRSRKIRVSNTPDVLNHAVADIALSLILATTRNLINADKFVRNKDWLRGPFPFGLGLEGKVLGIIGYGRIGKEIASRAEAFGLKIAYHNRKDKKISFPYYSNISDLASASDILLCMLPGGQSTKGIINENIFKKLGPDGIFINVGRGSSVDENALANALARHQIFAAGLDVYENEPSVTESLLALENVVLLPHIGSSTIETRRAMGQLVVDNLKAHFENQPLITETH